MPNYYHTHNLRMQSEMVEELDAYCEKSKLSRNNAIVHLLAVALKSAGHEVPPVSLAVVGRPSPRVRGALAGGPVAPLDRSTLYVRPTPAKSTRTAKK